jgi:outer membrane protein assembly factor BamA
VRYALSRKGFFDAFYDFGYYNKPEDVINKYPSQHGFLFGYGIGLRMETGLGVIGVNYALGKGDGFLDGKINFGIINEF